MVCFCMCVCIRRVVDVAQKAWNANQNKFYSLLARHYLPCSTENANKVITCEYVGIEEAFYFKLSQGTFIGSRKTTIDDYGHEYK